MTPRKPKNPKPSPSPKVESTMTKATTIHIPQDDRTRPATVHLYEAERKRGATASETVAYALSDAANVFKLISEGVATGHFARNDAGVISLAGICAAHFAALAENEGEHLLMLARRLNAPATTEDSKEEAQ